MDKSQYFQNLKDVITDSLYIGNSTEELDEEINNNMWRISLEQELAKQMDVTDYVGFFKNVIENRQQQVKDSKHDHGMIFYLWFDMMASQLRFNLISDLHKRLPFQCEYKLVEDMEPIIEEFLKSPFLNGLPIEGYFDDSEGIPFVLKVYMTEIYRNN